MVIKEREALLEQGVASITCLLSGLHVFSDAYNEQDKLLRLVKGVHAFHIYATEYWTEYLLTTAADCGGLEASPTLLSLAYRLTDVLEKVPLAPPSQPTTCSTTVDDRLSLLGQHSVLQKYVENALLARSQKQLEHEIQKLGENLFRSTTTRT